MTRRSRKPRFVAWFAAAGLLLAVAGALAHEYDHALAKHDAPCALHVFADHSGKGSPALAPLAAAAALGGALLPDVVAPPARCLLAAPRARAPPLLLRNT